MARKVPKTDIFIQNVQRFFYKLTKYRNYVFIGIAGLIVICAVAGYIKKTNFEKELVAKRLFYNALSDYTAGNIQRALESFKEITKSYGGTRVGARALYYLANCYYYLGKFEEARESFEKVLKKTKDEIFCQGALLGIADCYLQEGKILEAKEYYEKVKKRFPGTPVAELAKRRLSLISTNVQ